MKKTDKKAPAEKPPKAERPKAKARAKKAPKPDLHWRPRKVDRDALAEGELTTAAKKMNTVVDKCFRLTMRFRLGEAKYEAGMLGIYERIAPKDKGLTIVSADGDRRVIFSRKNVVRGNQNAVEAKLLIDEYVTEMLSRSDLSSDERNMAEFLTGVITQSKGHIKMTKNLIDFQRRKFQDPRLRKAQRLLGDGFDVHESKVYFHCEALTGGEWVKV